MNAERAGPSPVAPNAPPSLRLRRRLPFFALTVVLGAACNLLALRLPDAVPLLIGNVAHGLVALRLGGSWGAAAALVTAGVLFDPRWLLLGVLEAVLLARFGGEPRRYAAAYALVWLPLLPLVAWIVRPADGDAAMWTAGALVVLLNGALSLFGARLLAAVAVSQRRFAQQPLSAQLAGRLLLAIAPLLALLTMVVLRLRFDDALDARIAALQHSARELTAVVAGDLELHQRAIAVAADNASVEDGALPRLDRLHAVYPGFVTLLRTDADGRLVDYYTPQILTPVDSVADRHYFQEPRRTGRPFLSPVFRGRGFSNDLIVAVSAPYFASGGAFAGVIEGSLSLTRMIERLRTALGDAQAQFVVLDAERQVVVSTLPALAGLTPARDAVELLPAQLAGPGRALPVNAAATHLLATRTTPHSDWQLALLDPLQPIAREQTRLSLLGAVIALLLVLLAERVARQFADHQARPLHALVQRMRALDFNAAALLPALRVDGGSAEVGELVQDFDVLVARLRELHAELAAALAEQAHLNRELEHRVAMRTDELRVALHDAERLAQAKSTFLANMSHELRTPLAAILGYVEHALLQGTPPSTWLDTLVIIERNGRHLLAVVNDVLDASRIDAGQLVVEAIDCAPLAVVDEAVALLADRATEKGLALSREVAWPFPARVHSDPLRLKQVLINLIGNAIKFTSQGSIVVRLGVDSDAQQWWIAVADSGVGISTEQQARLFMPFEQADVSTTRRFGGSGLGLYICHQLVERLRGRISVQSTPGLGSVFELRFPLPASPHWLEHEPAAAAAGLQRTAIPALRGRVLVADDVDDLRRLVASMVRSTGADVVEAENGARAVELARGERFDLVLMDMHMPILDGVAATRALRAAGIAAPIVAVTADVLTEARERHLRAGCNATLAKPVEREQLYALLRAHLPAAAPPHAARAEDPAAAIADVMAQVRARFRAELVPVAAKLRQLHADRDRDALLHELHRLKGSAGTFGFMTISESAADAEAALRDHAPAFDARLRGLLADVAAEAAQAAAD